jgi:ABC-type branched-subunit amino acid transport system ATPase component
MNQPLLRAESVSRSFGGVVAVAGVSLEVSAGEILGLIGPNGSGKSTLLNLLTGTLQTDAGRIWFQESDVTPSVPHRRVRLGMVRLFQQSRVFPSLTLRENLRVVRGGVPDDTAHELLARVGLEDRIEELASALSYGQQRLLEFTRVLALRPKVVLLDEPTAGVHPKIVEVMRHLILDLSQTGTAVVIVEHNIDFVSSLADRLVALAEGKVIVEGTPEEVLMNSHLIAAYFGDAPDVDSTSTN